MNSNSSEVIDIRFLPSALIMWALSAVILLPLAALAAQLTGCGEKTFAYISSALSFLTAFFAGAKAIRVRKKNAVLTAFVSGVCIILTALSIGFLIDSSSLDPDGILSVVTFTLAGSFAGCMLFSGGGKNKYSKAPPKPKRR